MNQQQNCLHYWFILFIFVKYLSKFHQNIQFEKKMRHANIYDTLMRHNNFTSILDCQKLVLVMLFNSILMGGLDN